jgi:Condensation domain
MSADLQRPTDLLRGPLFAFALFKTEADRFLWYARYHHIVIDGLSRSLIARRVADVARSSGRVWAGHRKGVGSSRGLCAFAAAGGASRPIPGVPLEALHSLDEKIAVLDVEISRRAEEDEDARGLKTVPGICPVTAAAISASQTLARGRDFVA